MRPQRLQQRMVNPITIVLLPGMDGTGDLFAAFVRALSPRFKARVIRYPNEMPLSSDQLVAFVRTQLPIFRPFILLGESFSGPIAIRLAAERPDNLLALVLCASFARNPRPALAPLRSAINFLPMNATLKSLASRWALGRFSTPALRRELDAAIASVLPSILRARLRAVMDVDVTDALHRIRTPILSIRATHDALVPAAASQLIKSQHPNVDIHDVYAPHFLLQTAPKEASQAIEQFVAKHLISAA
jgi:pimeloyl-[acyl-carrier protein] methyl ester esterase